MNFKLGHYSANTDSAYYTEEEVTILETPVIQELRTLPGTLPGYAEFILPIRIDQLGTVGGILP